MSHHNVAIIGCGTIATNAHAPAYAKNPRTTVKYFIDIIPERAEKLSKEHNMGEVLADYREMLTDPEINLVSICVPNYLHAPITIECLNAGKHVLCEKPAGMNTAEVKAMKKAADDNKRILNIGVCNRFNNAVCDVRKLVEDGKLGNVYHVVCSFRDFRSIPGLGGPFTTKSLSGGGAVIDWGVHFFDLILYIAGVKDVLSVSAQNYSVLGKPISDYKFESMWAGPPIPDGVYDVEEFSTGIIRTDGPTITFNGSWAQNIRRTDMFVEFIGDKAGVRLEYGKDFELFTVKDGKLTGEKPEVEPGNHYESEIDAFITCAETGEKNKASVDKVIMSQMLMDAIYESSDKGVEVAVTKL